MGRILLSILPAERHFLRAGPGTRRGKQPWSLPLPERVLSGQGISAVKGTLEWEVFQAMLRPRKYSSHQMFQLFCTSLKWEKVE